MRDFPPSSGDSWFCLLPPALLFSLFSLEMTRGEYCETGQQTSKNFTLDLFVSFALKTF